MHTFDHTLPPDDLKKVRSNPKIQFHPVGVGSPKQNERFQYLPQIMADLEHKWIDVLKMDIEGSEWDLFQQIYDSSQASLMATQLLMEVHFRDNVTRVLQTFDKLLADNFRVFSVEPNYYCNEGCCARDLVEFAFIKISDRGEICTPHTKNTDAALKMPAGCLGTFKS